MNLNIKSSNTGTHLEMMENILANTSLHKETFLFNAKDVNGRDTRFFSFILKSTNAAHIVTNLPHYIFLYRLIQTFGLSAKLLANLW
jgi:hypothetical protein